MRIALFTNNYLPRMSGVATSVENLRLGLKALGHQVYVVAPKYPGAKQSRAWVIRVPSVRWSRKHFLPWSLPLSKKTTAQLVRLKLDVIHSHHPLWLGQSALKLAQQLKKPLVYTYHAQYDKYPEEFLGLAVKPWEQWAKNSLRDYMDQCAAVIAPTKIVAQQLKSQTRRRVIKIPSGIFVETFSRPRPTKAQAKKKLGLDRFDKIILSVARLSFEKEPDFALLALAPLLKNKPGLGLVMVGDGLAKKPLKQLAEETGITDQVVFPGTVQYRVLASWYRAADAFISTSLFETQGLTLIEALASGLPIVARYSKVTAECLGKPLAGGLVSPRNRGEFRRTVARVLTYEPERQQHYLNLARARAAKFSIVKIARQHEALYQRIID